MMMKVSQCMSN